VWHCFPPAALVHYLIQSDDLNSGYGLFFAIFDLSRRAAIHTSHAVELMVSGKPWTIRSIKDDFDDFEHINGNGGSRAPTTARIAQGAVLVHGGGDSFPYMQY